MIGGYATTVSCAIVQAPAGKHFPDAFPTFSSLVHSAGFALGVLLAVLLLANKRGNRAANRWLAAYISCLALLWFEDVVEETRVILVYPRSRTSPIGCCSSSARACWMYVRRLTKHEKPTFLWWLPHTWLAVLCFVFLATNFYFEPRAQKIADIRADYALLEHSLNEGVLIAAIHVMCYWVASLFVLRRLQRIRCASGTHLWGNVASAGCARCCRSPLVMWIIWFVSLLQVAPGSNALASVARGAGRVSAGVLRLAAAAGVFSMRRKRSRARGGAATTTATNATRYARSGMDRERVPEFLARLERT